MPVALADLKAELLTDPAAIGYAALLAAGSHNRVADALNLPRVGQSVQRSVVATWEIVEATVPAEWAALTAAERQRYQTLTALGTINVQGPNVRSQFAAMFGAGTTTRTNLLALQSRQGSRAEALFGEGERVTAEQVALALALP